MSASQDDNRKHLIISSWLTTEIIGCIMAFGLAVGSIAINAGRPLRASDPFVGILFQPSAIAIGKFGEQLYPEPRMLPASLATGKKRTLKQNIISTIEAD